MDVSKYTSGLELRSTATSGGELELSLVEVPLPELAPDEVLIRVEAAPLNPSDIGLLLGPADIATARMSGPPDRPVTTATIPSAALKGVAGRLDKALPVGNEGAGVVVKAGAGADAQTLVDKTVAVWGGGMYAQFRAVKAADCLVLPEGATAAEGASCFINPLTALGFIETMRSEGHSALIHTAAASNLGQMLNRICLKDGIGLVNIARSPEQVALLGRIGATHVCDSTAPGFMDDLTTAIAETGATLGFDAVGGGPLASQILTCMERAASKAMTSYNRYGSSVHKQVYLYGMLDTRPTELTRNYGMAWGVGGWLLPNFLKKNGKDVAARLRNRVADELTTTFASSYTAEISLAEALHPDIIAAYYRRSTGDKYLINPAKDRRRA
jgi:NADPH2:quinone reductase